MPPGIGYGPPRPGAPRRPGSRQYGWTGPDHPQPRLGAPPVGTLSSAFGPGPSLPGSQLNQMFTEMAMAAFQEVLASNLLYNPAVNPWLNPFPSEIPGNWATDRDAMDRQLEDAVPATSQIDRLFAGENAGELLRMMGLGDMVPEGPLPAAQTTPGGIADGILGPLFAMIQPHLPQPPEPGRSTFNPNPEPVLNTGDRPLPDALLRERSPYHYSSSYDLVRELLGGRR